MSSPSYQNDLRALQSWTRVGKLQAEVRSVREEFNAMRDEVAQWVLAVDAKLEYLWHRICAFAPDSTEAQQAMALASQAADRAQPGCVESSAQQRR